MEIMAILSNSSAKNLAGGVTEMDSRQQFEEWIDSNGLRRLCSGNDEEQGISLFWLAWQASRESLVVELPEGFTYHGQSDQTEYVFEEQSVHDAIHATGIRTK